MYTWLPLLKQSDAYSDLFTTVDEMELAWKEPPLDMVLEPDGMCLISNLCVS